MSHFVPIVFLLFLMSQSCYFVANLAFLWLRTTPRRRVKERPPNRYRQIHTLVPAYRERREVLESTLERITAGDYPLDRITVYLIYEDDDKVVTSYADSVADSLPDLDIRLVEVRKDDPVWEEVTRLRWTGLAFPRGKARALTYALYKLDLDEVVTVLDSDTAIPTDLFSLGVVGLEEYEIVQAKQTVANRRAGWLPLLEAMGIAAWSQNIYERAATWPYQLLGKGYFIEASTLYDLIGWDPYEATEDLALGIDAYAKGYRLGIIDRYVEDFCPPKSRDWIRQKRRWVSGPYSVFVSSKLSVEDRIRFATYALINQVTAVVNVIGVPTGFYALAHLALYGPLPIPEPFGVILAINLFTWTLYSVDMYRAADRAIAFESRAEKWRYFLVSNPFTQALYSTLWAIPILQAVKLRLQRRAVGFTVTPK
ncbi:glycosyltransferase family 2 protein [Haladaptatus sp. GCM10025707]|uniref:glycosyltransferase family 2 protein n=1 Tax=unclassified Haladaptatus TaxID=2622732 RepID=UPI0023E75CB8|nr:MULTISPECIES: glycosyltransferase family 2 protein [unclassified Haladaptatus]